MRVIRLIGIVVAAFAATLVYNGMTTAFAGGAVVSHTTIGNDGCNVRGGIERCFDWERDRHDVQTPSGNRTITIRRTNEVVWTVLDTNVVTLDQSVSTKQHVHFNDKKNSRIPHVSMWTRVITDNLTGCVTTTASKRVNGELISFTNETVCP